MEMVKGNREIRGMMEVALAFTLAGSSIVAGKFLSTSIPLFTTGFFSLLFALIVLVPLQIKRKSTWTRITKRELGLMFLQALTGIFLTRLFTLYGLKYTGAVSAGLINSSMPAVMAIASIIFLGERPGRGIFRGLVLVLAGLFLLSRRSGTQGGSGSLWGGLLIFFSVLSEVAMSLLRKKSRAEIDSLTNTTILFIMALVLFLPFAAGEWRSFPLSDIEPIEWLVLLYYGFFGSALAYIFWGSGVMKIPGTLAGMAFAMIPVSAVSLSALLLGEEVGLPGLAAITLCLGGMIIGNRKPATPPES